MSVYEKVKKVLNGLQIGFKALKGVDSFAREHHIDRVSKLTGKLLNNEYVKKTEQAVEIGNRLSDAYDQHKKTGLFNKTHPELNRQGEQHAIRQRRRVLGSVPVSTHPIETDERQMAERIVQNMNYRT